MYTLNKFARIWTPLSLKLLFLKKYCSWKCSFKRLFLRGDTFYQKKSFSNKNAFYRIHSSRDCSHCTWGYMQYPLRIVFMYVGVYVCILSITQIYITYIFFRRNMLASSHSDKSFCNSDAFGSPWATSSIVVWNQNQKTLNSTIPFSLFNSFFCISREARNRTRNSIAL